MSIDDPNGHLSSVNFLMFSFVLFQNTEQMAYSSYFTQEGGHSNPLTPLLIMLSAERLTKLSSLVKSLDLDLVEKDMRGL